MTTSTISSKGRTVIPSDVRDVLGLHSGDKVDFVIQENGSVLLKPATQDISKLKGILHKPDRKPVSLDAMKQAIKYRGSGNK
ncbi:MAG: AbrB/MazE/SpoVT family DNA-binding domain-containing protein [Spartobacteria bacterium]|nr:AbrB/MazE/SpoVT family DNA-binding domain-containing protein [Spartobacteria bacterium]